MISYLIFSSISLNQGAKFDIQRSQYEPDIAMRESFLRHLSWEVPKNNTGCRNTVQGRQLICDDKGVVCKRENVNYDGCCLQPALQFHCSAQPECDQSASCCSLFEYCVACCLQPANKDTLAKFVRDTLISLEKLFGSIKNQFDLCLTKCRTSSLSGTFRYLEKFKLFC